MAKITLRSTDATAILMKMNALGNQTDGICKQAIYAGAQILVDQIRANLDALPTDKFRFLQDSDRFTGVPEMYKRDLQEDLGIAPMQMDFDGNWNTKIGFEDCGILETNAYPMGVPLTMLARAVESGSSYRAPTPFVRPAISKARSRAHKAMAQKVEEEIKKLMK